ncbi:MAG: dTDP-4-dehydrorhamnose reductase [Hyphomonadaceae bacterium]
MLPVRIACIGRSGQVAQALSAAAAAEPGAIDLLCAGRERLDLARPETLERFIDEARPDAVINAAAYNLVDRAETEPEIAMAINAEGPRTLARACRERGLPFIHMSTDCVFRGDKTAPYTEDDEPLPMSVYGRSKHQGERAVWLEYPEALTVRVCWVFSEFGATFVSRMIELAATRPVLKVVHDQYGPPTYAPDIARALLTAVREKLAGADDLSGVLHVASPDVMNRSFMARQILAASRWMGGPHAAIEAVSTEAFGAAAPRPQNAVLSGLRATRRLQLRFTPFGQALERSVSGVLTRT